MKISLEKLYQKAATRPPGYLDEVISAGVIKDGFLHIGPHDYLKLLDRYNPDHPAAQLAPSPIPHSPLPTPHLRGLGDAAALIAKPLARAIDKVTGSNLQNCPACAKRQAKLNAAIPFK